VFKHFLAAKFDTGKSVLELKAGANSIGRNEFEIADKRVSRQQLELLVDTGKSTVQLIQRGVNRVLLTQPSGARKFTVKDEPVTLQDGDTFGLIGDEYAIVLEVEELESAGEGESVKSVVAATATVVPAAVPVAAVAAIAPAKKPVAAAAVPVAAVGDELLARVLQAEFDEEARVEKATKARSFGNEMLADQILATRNGRVAGLGVGLKRDASGTIRTKKRAYGLTTTESGIRKSARPHKKVDYAEANFAFIDTDDEAEDGGEAAAAMEASFDSSADDWQPRDDTEPTGVAELGTSEFVDGKPKCVYGSACYRKNPKHFLETWHPAGAASGAQAATSSVAVAASAPKEEAVLEGEGLEEEALE
jgi:hypothetical protein